LGIKIIGPNGCEVFKIYSCIVVLGYKQFQDFENFEFMDNILYDFEN